jgi:hypothetical protein
MRQINIVVPEWEFYQNETSQESPIKSYHPTSPSSSKNSKKFEDQNAAFGLRKL